MYSKHPFFRNKTVVNCNYKSRFFSEYSQMTTFLGNFAAINFFADDDLFWKISREDTFADLAKNRETAKCSTFEVFSL